MVPPGGKGSMQTIEKISSRAPSARPPKRWLSSPTEILSPSWSRMSLSRAEKREVVVGMLVHRLLICSLYCRRAKAVNVGKALTSSLRDQFGARAILVSRKRAQPCTVARRSTSGALGKQAPARASDSLWVIAPPMPVGITASLNPTQVADGVGRALSRQPRILLRSKNPRGRLSFKNRAPGLVP